MPEVIFIEGCNYEDYPVGGQLSFARQMMQAFGNQLALVGISTDDAPIGCWNKKEINGVVYDFFNIGYWRPSSCKPLIPYRITGYFQTRKYKREIMGFGIRSVFVQAPEILFAIQDWGWENICCCCPGVKNPLINPRYMWGKIFAGVFYKKWVSALSKVDLVLAAADDCTINDFIINSKGKLAKDQIIKFPTRVDTSLFKPIDKIVSRRQLGINSNIPLIVNCGRINVVKGWKFLVDSFNILKQNKKDAKLFFIGDGEDRPKLEKYISQIGLSNHVKVMGFQSSTKIVKYLNAADVIAIGSKVEGWSIAMLEALACGKAIVSTPVSGAHDMIVEGHNGYIVKERDTECFAEAMNLALTLKDADKISLGIAEKYALKHLSRDLSMLWAPLSLTDQLCLPQI